MGFISAAEAAQLWGVSERSVRNYCAQGRVPGAFLTGKTWSIPEGAVKPQRLNAKDRDESPLLKRLREEKSARVRGGIYHKLQIDLAYNSNHIEGSRLSLDQTRLIFETHTISPSAESVRVDDIVEAANHFRAFDYVIDGVFRPLTQTVMKELHGILKSSTSDAVLDWFTVGDYKRIPNEVAGRQTTPPEQVAAELDDLLKAYEPARAHTLEEIVAFHVAFERIHPFQDGNGRVGRLVMFKECLASDIVPFVVFDDMKAFYYRGLSEWDVERGYLLDTLRSAQDKMCEVFDYFNIDRR